MKFRDGSFYATEKVSPTRIKTPEGYLICQAVPISRVGEFEYSALEVGGAVKGKGGKVIMTRTPEELFRPETIASFEGKPVVIGHARFADPQNINAISVGHVQNVRQGEGDQSGFLLADLFLDSQRGIDIVERGELEEVSCGYDARAIDDGDGRGHQEGIVGNHLALVKKARCGEACKIGDGSMSNTKMTLKQRIRRLFRDGDEDGLNEVLDESEVVAKDDAPPAPPADDPLVALMERLDKVEKLLAAMQTPPAQDEETADEDGLMHSDRLVFSAESADWFSDEEAGATSARVRGIVLHRILSCINSPADIVPAVYDAVDAGLVGDDEAEDLSEFFRSRLESVASMGWFPETGAKILNEAEIIDGDGSVYRPDRVVIREDGSVAVVDYKFGSPKPSYLKQIAGYADLWRRMGHENVTSHLWYVMSGEIVSGHEG